MKRFFQISLRDLIWVLLVCAMLSKSMFERHRDSKVHKQWSAELHRLMNDLDAANHELEETKNQLEAAREANAKAVAAANDSDMLPPKE